MPIYEIQPNAGSINYADWYDRGIRMPIFDKDGTLTHVNKLELVDEVIEGLRENLVGVFQTVAVASNNREAKHVKIFESRLKDALGVEVFSICAANGYPPKANPTMGFAIADNFGLMPDQLAVIGDRRLTDVSFGRRLGAGAIALCSKVGEGDAPWVPTARKLENGIVGIERLLQFAV